MRTTIIFAVAFSLGVILAGQRKPQIQIPNGFGGDVCWQTLGESCVIENAQSRAKELGVEKWRTQIVIPYGFTGEVCWEVYIGMEHCITEDVVTRRNNLFAQIPKSK